MRMPPYPNSAVAGSFWDNFETVSIPAPPSVHVKGADPMLYYEVTVAGSTASTLGPLEDSSFYNSYPVSQLKKDTLRVAVARDASNRSMFTLDYRLWVDDVMWTGTGQTDKLPAPTNLRLAPGDLRALTWDWKGDPLDTVAYIVYRLYSCPAQDGLAAPQVVDSTDRKLPIPAHTEFPGCAVRYQVSAYGQKGESPPSKPYDVEATPGTARMSVSFTKLTVEPKSGKDVVHTQLTLSANQNKLNGYVSLKKGVNKLNEFLIGGKDNNNSLLIDVAEKDKLQIGIVLGNTTKSMFVSRPTDTTWKEFRTVTRNINLEVGGDKYVLTVVIGGEGPTPSGSKLLTADISISKPVACGSGGDKLVSGRIVFDPNNPSWEPPDICVILKNNGPDPVASAPVNLGWTWSDAHVAPERLSSTYSISRWIGIPVGGQQWVKIIDAADEAENWSIHERLKYLEVEYTPGIEAGLQLQDPDTGNNKAWAYVDWRFFTP